VTATKLQDQLSIASKWLKKRAGVLLGLVLITAYILYGIDGAMYVRYIPARHLRIVHKSWKADGAPEPPVVEKYVGGSRTYVDSSTYVIDGHTYEGLFAHQEPAFDHLGTYVITRDGVIIVIKQPEQPRLLWIHPTRAAAW
jgi:hypothetical protein